MHIFQMPDRNHSAFIMTSKGRYKTLRSGGANQLIIAISYSVASQHIFFFRMQGCCQNSILNLDPPLLVPGLWMNLYRFRSLRGHIQILGKHRPVDRQITLCAQNLDRTGPVSLPDRLCGADCSDTPAKDQVGTFCVLSEGSGVCLYRDTLVQSDPADGTYSQRCFKNFSADKAFNQCRFVRIGNFPQQASESKTVFINIVQHRFIRNSLYRKITLIQFKSKLYHTISQSLCRVFLYTI